MIGNRVPIVRPSWDVSHMEMAIKLSERSCDANTKVGAVIVDPYNHPIGTGYNSFPKGFPDDILPNARDEAGSKHDWMVHAEINALINVTSSTFFYPQGVTLYCTVRPCLRCLGPLINANVTQIVSINGNVWSGTKQEEQKFYLFLEYGKIEYYELQI